MNIIISIIRLIFFPVWLISNFIYDDPPPLIAGFSWYTKKDYLNVIADAKDDKDSLLSFEQWKEKAENRKKEMEDRNYVFFKVRIKSYEMNAWLKKNELININENRERYVEYRLREFLKEPLI